MARHVLFRLRVPVPHVLVQSVHALHRDHLDSVLGTRLAITATSTTLLANLISLIVDKMLCASLILLVVAAEVKGVIRGSVDV